MEFIAVIGLIVVGSAGLISVLLLSSLINGWALSVMWGWFIVPVFSAPPLSLGQAIGVAMVVSFLTYQFIDDSPKSDENKTAKIFVSILLRPVFAVLFGLLVKTVFGI